LSIPVTYHQFETGGIVKKHRFWDDGHMNTADTTKLDGLTRKYTAYVSFAAMVDDSTRSDYFPTLRVWGTKPLADAYDAAMQARGDARRAWRGIRKGPRVRPDQVPGPVNTVRWMGSAL
jgi:hypothetical protein